MSRAQEIAAKRAAMDTIMTLTGVFEGLASMRISQVKNQVLQSQQFFNELWQIYSQLRVDSLFRFGRTQTDDVVAKDLFIIVTAQGGFSGDIDQKLIRTMVKEYNPDKQDIMVIGHHGAVQLAQLNIKFKKYFSLPAKDTNINVQPLVKEVKRYQSTVVFYQTYISLMDQQIKRIELHSAVQQVGESVTAGQEIISEETYIFEPSTFDVVAHLERSMLQITLGQLILDSKLAQYASRFRAMSMANDKASELSNDLRLAFNRTKRRTQDERLKEIINGLRKTSTT